MKTSKPEAGALYVTSSGRTAEVVAYAALNATTEVIAWRYLGGSVVHISALGYVMDWVKVPGE